MKLTDIHYDPITGILSNRNTGRRIGTLNDNGKGHKRQIKVDQKTKFLGLFTSQLEAHERYIEEAKKLFGDYFNSGSFSVPKETTKLGKVLRR